MTAPLNHAAEYWRPKNNGNGNYLEVKKSCVKYNVYTIKIKLYQKIIGCDATASHCHPYNTLSNKTSKIIYKLLCIHRTQPVFKPALFHLRLRHCDDIRTDHNVEHCAGWSTVA